VTKTERLYYEDARLTEFRARVVERSADGHRVYLDRTGFYPTSGGQPHDTGTLGGVAVIDVVDEGERIAHLLSGVLPQPDDEVTGVVDARRRRDHMQQHTGQHLLSAVLHDLFGWTTVSVHFGADSSTLDVDVSTGDVTTERLTEAQRRCNEIVTDDRVVAVSFEHSAEASGLRKPSDREGVLRVVTIEGVDRSACGGTHVRSTGEIGVVLLRRFERVKQGTRIEFLCGSRGVERARQDYESLARTAHSLSCAIDDVPAAVSAFQEQARESEKRRRALEAELAAGRARALYDATPPGSDGVRRAMDRRAVRASEMKDAGEAMRATALAYVLAPSAIFVGVVESEEAGTPASVLVAASDDSGLDAGAALRTALSEVGGRGGGSSRLAQGSVAADGRLHSVLVALGVLHS
jgi:alanyl-tRNA synthetase